MSEHRIDLSQLSKVRDGTGHSVFGASGSGMFLNCTGSLVPNLLVKDDGNEYAAYGSIAHAVTEVWLLTGKKPVHLLGEVRQKDGFDIEIDEVMLDFAQECVDRCELEPGEHLIEKRVDYSDLTPIPNQGGTGDFVAMRYQHCSLKDHKFGIADVIMAEWNTQLMLYAYGIFLEYDWLYDFQVFELTILQPRLDHYDTWTCTREELLQFAAWAKTRMHEAWAIDAPRTPGDKQCRYCKVRSSCVAAARWQAQLCEGIFGDETATVEDMEEFKERLDDPVGFKLNLLAPGTLSTAEIVELFRFHKTAMRFWNSLGVELFKRAQMNGENLSEHGLKLVNGRGKRYFSDPKASAAFLIEQGMAKTDVWVTKIISPAQAEKALRKLGFRGQELENLLVDFYTKTPGKAVLAPIFDKRPAISDIDDAVFDDESNSANEET